MNLCSKTSCVEVAFSPKVFVSLPYFCHAGHGIFDLFLTVNNYCILKILNSAQTVNDFFSGQRKKQASLRS